MKIDIQTTNTELTASLEATITAKLEKLQQFHSEILTAIVYLKEESSTQKETQIKLLVKENTLFSKAEEDKFEKSVDQAIEALRRQLKKHKEKKK